MAEIPELIETIQVALQAINRRMEKELADWWQLSQEMAEAEARLAALEEEARKRRE